MPLDSKIQGKAKPRLKLKKRERGIGRCLGPNGTQIGFVAGNGDLINPILIGFHRFKHNGPAEVIHPFAWMHIGLPQIFQQVFLL
jgi:hypothetical protein